MLDFQEFYGIDLSTPGLLEARTWHWFELRLLALLTHGDNNGIVSTESRLQRVLRPSTPPPI